MIDITNLEKWHFGMTEDMANDLLKLVLAGKKRATASSFLGYGDDEPLPKVGEISVITDWKGTPGCVIQTTNVRIIPYCEITYDIAKLEGEDDTLESWQKNHEAFFREEGQQLGYTFTEDMPVVFEEFKVVEIL